MNPIPEEKFSAILIQAIAALKQRLVARYERHFPGRSAGVRAALEVAEAAAWCTPFPQLFLPELAEQQIALLIPAAQNSAFMTAR
jgi:hypothetical protein